MSYALEFLGGITPNPHVGGCGRERPPPEHSPNTALCVVTASYAAARIIWRLLCFVVISHIFLLHFSSIRHPQPLHPVILAAV